MGTIRGLVTYMASCSVQRLVQTSLAWPQPEVLNPGCDVAMRADSYLLLRAEAGGGALPGERWKDIGLNLEEADLRLRQAGVRS